MRTEQEMMDLILKTAREDERIRAVYMNGSRTNPHAPKDLFQDYDIVYVVRETKSFREDRGWIDRFGKRLYMQYPEESGEAPDREEHMQQCYGWLMQFADGNRMDLHVETIPFSQQEIQKDRLCQILLDKDGILPPMPESTDRDFWIPRPSPKAYADCCNEFWWCLNNVAKGLWREEIPYVQDMVNQVVRPQLVTMLSWKVGIQTDFTCSGGKSGKYLHRWLAPEIWERFLKTYSSGVVSEMWDACFEMCRLFWEISQEVAQKLQFPFCAEEAQGSWGFFKHVRTLPKDAKAIYENSFENS